MIEIKEKKTEEQEIVLNFTIRQRLIEALLRLGKRASDRAERGAEGRLEK